MELGGWDKEESPYHAGEQELHARLGREAQQERMGRRVFRPFMPDQHRTFFAQLPFFVAGSVDNTGAPWASILFGKPGFVSSPDDRSLAIDATAIPHDPFGANANQDAPVSFVGIELPTRRRNRVNGVVRGRSEGQFMIDVVQSFGNCPQYIHTREMAFVRDPAEAAPEAVERFTSLTEETRRIISKADTLFVASHNPKDDPRINGGVDVNHRGGNPGFIKIDGDTLTVPDFIGNFAFNTLGNFVVNPKAGLLFIDFDTGDIVQLTGSVELLWDPDPETRAFRGAERAWRFQLEHGHRLVAASPLRFEDGEASPNARLTGSWTEAAEALDAEAQRLEWRPFRVSRIEDESSVIRSFHLEPSDGKATLPYKPGQYLTVRVHPEGEARPLVRTYTLSSAPADSGYRISVKRESASPGKPAGRVSSHLHDMLKVGDLIETRAPNGVFWLDTSAKRPAVLIAAGVGVTPMISMARQARSDGFARRHLRPLTVFHSARSTSERAFAKEFSELEKQSAGGIKYVSLVTAAGAGEAAGVDFHEEGRISPAILQRHLPIADYDFYLCGPAGFMQDVYDMLMGLGIRDARIHAEAFGPASLKRQHETPVEAAPVEEVEEADEALVHFTGSDVELPWTPKDGTLLELAEAHGIAPNYGCRSGACGTCAVPLRSGNVTHRTIPEFPAEDGDVLICCAVPAPSEGAIKIDL